MDTRMHVCEGMCIFFFFSLSIILVEMDIIISVPFYEKIHFNYFPCNIYQGMCKHTYIITVHRSQRRDASMQAFFQVILVPCCIAQDCRQTGLTQVHAVPALPASALSSFAQLLCSAAWTWGAVSIMHTHPATASPMLCSGFRKVPAVFVL